MNNLFVNLLIRIREIFTHESNATGKVQFLKVQFGSFAVNYDKHLDSSCYHAAGNSFSRLPLHKLILLWTYTIHLSAQPVTG